MPDSLKTVLDAIEQLRNEQNGCEHMSRQHEEQLQQQDERLRDLDARLRTIELELARRQILIDDLVAARREGAKPKVAEEIWTERNVRLAMYVALGAIAAVGGARVIPALLSALGVVH